MFSHLQFLSRAKSEPVVGARLASPDDPERLVRGLHNKENQHSKQTKEIELKNFSSMASRPDQKHATACLDPAESAVAEQASPATPRRDREQGVAPRFIRGVHAENLPDLPIEIWAIILKKVAQQQNWETTHSQRSVCKGFNDIINTITFFRDYGVHCLTKMPRIEALKPLQQKLTEVFKQATQTQKTTKNQFECYIQITQFFTALHQNLETLNPEQQQTNYAQILTTHQNQLISYFNTLKTIFKDDPNGQIYPAIVGLAILDRCTDADFCAKQFNLTLLVEINTQLTSMITPSELSLQTLLQLQTTRFLPAHQAFGFASIIVTNHMSTDDIVQMEDTNQKIDTVKNSITKLRCEINNILEKQPNHTP